MLGEDIYREFAVRKAEVNVEEDGGRTTFRCEMEGWHGHKVAFHLIIAGCAGEKEYKAQYDAIVRHCTVGALLHCSIVYRRRSNAFVMCIDQLMPITPCSVVGERITADEYLDRNRGFWVRTMSSGDWVNMPGAIELSGESCIPLVEEDSLPLVEYRYDYDKGLHYGKRPSALQRALNWAFAT